jgi:branched-chain amino acid transport system substrate-binding protein
MKLGRLAVSGLVVAAVPLLSACGSKSPSSATSASTKSSGSCKASIEIMAPFATGPGVQQGLEQLHFAELAVAMGNQTNHTDVSYGEADTGLNPSLAVTRTKAAISSNAVAAVGPAGSAEVEAVGPLFARAGMADVNGSATKPGLGQGIGPNSTFFRVVPDDNVQGPKDANYVIKHLKPKAVLIIDDEESYSTGLVSVVAPILQHAGIKVNHQSYNGTATGSTLSSALSSLVTSQLTPDETVVMLPWQNPANAQLFGKLMQQQGKKATIFGFDGLDAPGQFEIPGSYVSAVGPDISEGASALDKAVVSGIKKYGPYGTFGVPEWQATTVVMDAIASVCKAGQTPNRANVLAAVRQTDIPASQSLLGIPIKFQPDGDVVGKPGYLFHITGSGKYVEIPDQ